MRAVNLSRNGWPAPGLGFHSLEEFSQATRSERHPVSTALEMNMNNPAPRFGIFAHDRYAVFVFGHDFVSTNGLMVFEARIAMTSGITEFKLAKQACELLILCHSHITPGCKLVNSLDGVRAPSTYESGVMH